MIKTIIFSFTICVVSTQDWIGFSQCQNNQILPINALPQNYQIQNQPHYPEPAPCGFEQRQRFVTQYLCDHPQGPMTRVSQMPPEPTCCFQANSSPQFQPPHFQPPPQFFSKQQMFRTVANRLPQISPEQSFIMPPTQNCIHQRPAQFLLPQKGVSPDETQCCQCIDTPQYQQIPIHRTSAPSVNTHIAQPGRHIPMRFFQQKIPHTDLTHFHPQTPQMQSSIAYPQCGPHQELYTSTRPSLFQQQSSHPDLVFNGASQDMTC